ncbi:putative 54S ribosomal protein L19, mitochondrial precursor [Myxozyma melibiosi]|uniref:54S ribosomal protein L19, mitochondrial n=1 Tax=Myxozyma melibiosi TaxID=54550 RepID=A0ABR1F6S8_9ASCO
MAARAKDITVKLIVEAGKASPSPPVGPALGSKGVKAMDFCKEFNARTAHYTPGVPIPTSITIKPDRTFTFVTKSPTTSFLILRAAGAAKGAGEYGNGQPPVGKISLKHVYEIAKIKHKDLYLSGLSLEAIAKQVVATAKTVGVEVLP